MKIAWRSTSEPSTSLFRGRETTPTSSRQTPILVSWMLDASLPAEITQLQFACGDKKVATGRGTAVRSIRLSPLTAVR